MDKEDGQGWQVCCVTLKWGFWGNGWKRGWKRPYASVGIFEFSLRRMRSVWILRFELKNLSTGGCHLCPATAGQPLVKEYRGQQVANKLNWAGSPPCRKTKECGKDTLSASDAHGTSTAESVCIASKHFWSDLSLSNCSALRMLVPAWNDRIEFLQMIGVSRGITPSIIYQWQILFCVNEVVSAFSASTCLQLIHAMQALKSSACCAKRSYKITA